jgi:8-oxo-dGTP diphosphatase
VKVKVFCSFCGDALEVDFHDGKERQVCKACAQVYYENPLPVASVILANRDREIILVKRARDPFKNMWCCPIGFAESGESIEDAALRELKEETGIEGRITQLVDVSSHTNPFYGDLLIVSFEAEKVGGTEQAGG